MTWPFAPPVSLQAQDMMKGMSDDQLRSLARQHGIDADPAQLRAGTHSIPNMTPELMQKAAKLEASAARPEQGWARHLHQPARPLHGQHARRRMHAAAPACRAGSIWMCMQESAGVCGARLC